MLVAGDNLIRSCSECLAFDGEFNVCKCKVEDLGNERESGRHVDERKAFSCFFATLEEPK